MKKFIALTLLSLSLLSCDDKSTSMPKKQEEVYDFRNEKYQDFYSKFAREVDRRSDLNAHVENDSFAKSFDKEYINKVLGLDLKEDIVFKLHIVRVELDSYNELYNTSNHFADENDVWEAKKQSRYRKYIKYRICSDDFQIEGLFCLAGSFDGNAEKHGTEYHYYYLPKKSTKIIPHVNQSIKFQCENIDSAHGEYIRCILYNYPDQPYNLDINIYFSENPENFFHMIEYVEKYIHNITGEHIWQNLPQES